MSSIDIIVPCYRYGQYLAECVQSVLLQGTQNLRVLILDDASPDATPEIGAALARADSRVTYIRHAINKGHIATYNEGLEWASADYLLLLSADDYLLPGALRRAIDFMDAHLDAGFTFGMCIQKNVDGTEEQIKSIAHRLEKPVSRVLEGREFIELSGACNIVPTPTAVVRTSLQRRVGGYLAELPHSGDQEMWLRLASHASVGFLGEYQAVYRRHKANMSLAYTGRHIFRDIQQRKLALELFSRTCNSTLRAAADVRRNQTLLLGAEAVGCANSAFNSEAIESADELARLALVISPDVKASWQWKKFVWKRRFGFRGWRVLQSARFGLAQVFIPRT